MFTKEKKAAMIIMVLYLINDMQYSQDLNTFATFFGLGCATASLVSIVNEKQVIFRRPKTILKRKRIPDIYIDTVLNDYDGL